MFTGIVESLGKVVSTKEMNGNMEIEVASDFTPELKINQSISHNGACLSVTRIGNGTYTVTMVEETLRKTALGNLKVNDFVNLERAMAANGRFDGHIVLGHVDTVGTCISIKENEGSHLLTFQHPAHIDFFTVEKGSITVNGISLTVVNSTINEFSVAIIPFTFTHTNLQTIRVGDKVNLEFDILGKYMKKIVQR